MWYRYCYGVILLCTGSFLLYYLQTHMPYGSLHFSFYPSSPNKTLRHTAIILAKQPTNRVLRHLNALLKVGVDAYVMCDEDPSKFTDVTPRHVYVTDQSLARYRLTRNRVWDRVFLWLYNQSSIEYVWIMEDDLTWAHVRHMLALFRKYENNPADLLSKDIIYKNNQTLGWMWWPKMILKILPESKWSGALNMLSRVSRRLIKAHQYYIEQMFNERKNLSDNQFDQNYYFQEFLIPTVGHMFNLTMLIYDSSNMEVSFTPLSEDDVARSLKNGKQIFHAVKHQSPLLVNATEVRRR